MLWRVCSKVEFEESFTLSRSHSRHRRRRHRRRRRPCRRSCRRPPLLFVLNPSNLIPPRARYCMLAPQFCADCSTALFSCRRHCCIARSHQAQRLMLRILDAPVLPRRTPKSLCYGSILMRTALSFCHATDACCSCGRRRLVPWACLLVKALQTQPWTARQ